MTEAIGQMFCEGSRRLRRTALCLKTCRSTGTTCPRWRMSVVRWPVARPPANYFRQAIFTIKPRSLPYSRDGGRLQRRLVLFWQRRATSLPFHRACFMRRGIATSSSVLVLFLDKDHPVAEGIRQPSVTNGQGAKRLDEILDCVATRLVGHQTPEQLQISSTLTNLITQSEARLCDVAEELGYSPDGFTRSFCRWVGTTPAKYRIAHRLTMARSMIRQGAMLAEVAFATGFSDQSHLGRCFLRAFGTTPAAYRAGLVAMT